MEDQRVQRLYLEYKSLSEQAQKVQEYLQQSEQNLAEVSNVIDAIGELGKLKAGERILAPIANGIFIGATLNDPSTLRMNVGGGAVAIKSVAEAQQLLEEQRKELMELRERAGKEHAKIAARLREIEESVEKE